MESDENVLLDLVDEYEQRIRNGEQVNIEALAPEPEMARRLKAGSIAAASTSPNKPGNIIP